MTKEVIFQSTDVYFCFLVIKFNRSIQSLVIEEFHVQDDYGLYEGLEILSFYKIMCSDIW